MYYKLISNNKIIGVISENNFRRYQPKHGLILFANEDSGQFVDYNNKYYRDYWLKEIPKNLNIIYELVDIVRVEEDEYNILSETLETQKQIEIEEPEIIEEPQEEEALPIDENKVITLDFVKEQKVNKMKKACHDAIISGTDVTLSDRKVHHFSFKIEDQIKIQSLMINVDNDDQILFWHDDNGTDKFINASDVVTIYEAMNNVRNYHTAYFNSLKAYINSMNNIEIVASVQYGINIPREYQSEVFKYILNNTHK